MSRGDLTLKVVLTDGGNVFESSGACSLDDIDTVTNRLLEDVMDCIEFGGDGYIKDNVGMVGAFQNSLCYVQNTASELAELEYTGHEKYADPTTLYIASSLLDKAMACAKEVTTKRPNIDEDYAMTRLLSSIDKLKEALADFGTTALNVDQARILKRSIDVASSALNIIKAVAE